MEKKKKDSLPRGLLEAEERGVGHQQSVHPLLPATPMPLSPQRTEIEEVTNLGHTAGISIQVFLIQKSDVPPAQRYRLSGVRTMRYLKPKLTTLL